MQFVSVDVVFHEKQRVVKFLRHIFSKWFRSNTEQFLFHGRIEVSSVCYSEPTDNLLWKFFHKNTVAKSMVNGVLIYTVTRSDSRVIFFHHRRPWCKLKTRAIYIYSVFYSFRFLLSSSSQNPYSGYSLLRRKENKCFSAAFVDTCALWAILVDFR